MLIQSHSFGSSLWILLRSPCHRAITGIGPCCRLFLYCLPLFHSIFDCCFVTHLFSFLWNLFFMRLAFWFFWWRDIIGFPFSIARLLIFLFFFRYLFFFLFLIFFLLLFFLFFFINFHLFLRLEFFHFVAGICVATFFIFSIFLFSIFAFIFFLLLFFFNLFMMSLQLFNIFLMRCLSFYLFSWRHSKFLHNLLLLFFKCFFICLNFVFVHYNQFLFFLRSFLAPSLLFFCFVNEYFLFLLFHVLPVCSNDLGDELGVEFLVLLGKDSVSFLKVAVISSRRFSLTW